MTLFDYFRTYPSTPGFKARDTSEAAAQAMRPKAHTLRQMCLRSLRSEGPATADEIAARIGVDKLSIRPRCSELSAVGKIVATPERRLNASGKSAVVWQLA